MTQPEATSGMSGLGNSHLLAAIVESSDDAILSKTLPEGVITSWNRAAERMYGYRAEEAIGKSVRMLVPEDRISEWNDIMRRVGRGEKIARLRTERVTQDGQIIQVSVSISPVRDNKGKIVGASSIAHEVDPDEARMDELRAIALASAQRASRVDDLTETVRKQNEALTDVGSALAGFVPSDELTERLDVVEKKVNNDLTNKVNRLGKRLVVLVVMIALMAMCLSAGLIDYNRVSSCHRRNASNQVIRDIVDRSTNQAGIYDVAKLSPDTKRILGEVAAAQKGGNGKAFHDYVDTKTQHQNCSLIP